MGTLRTRFLAMILCTCTLATAACSGSTSGSGQGSGAKPSQVAADFSHEDAEIQDTLDAAVDAGLAPGAVALVRRGDQTEVFVSGLADRKRHLAMMAHDRFRIGSVSKPMLATVVLQLVDEQKLSLDDTVQQWLPGLVPNAANITLQELLSHTSGLFDFANLPMSRSLFRAGNLAPADLVRLATAHQPTFPPGTDTAYSNTGYVVLGMIIEQATGSSLEDNLDTRIFAPLGMTHTSADQSHAMDPPLAHGYEHGKDVTQADMSGVWGAGAVVSTAPDVSRFFTALLGGRLIPEDLLKQMTAFHTGSLLGFEHYGFGIGEIDVGGCTTAYGHDGAIFGFLTQAWTSADQDRQVIMMVNTDDGGYDSLGSTFGPVIENTFCAS